MFFRQTLRFGLSDEGQTEPNRIVLLDERRSNDDDMVWSFHRRPTAFIQNNTMIGTSVYASTTTTTNNDYYYC
jgi:hypothetical protein